MVFRNTHCTVDASYLTTELVCSEHIPEVSRFDYAQDSSDDLVLCVSFSQSLIYLLADVVVAHL